MTSGVDNLKTYKNNIKNVTENKLEYIQFTHKEILIIINTLRQSTSPGVDSISSNLLLQILDYIVKPLFIYLINLSFFKGIFPEIYK